MISPNEPVRPSSAHNSPGGVDLGRVWTSVAAEVWRRHPGWIERTAARLLRSPGLARALVITPSLLLPWLISTVVVLGAGALISVGPGQPLAWLVAPAVTAVPAAKAAPADLAVPVDVPAASANTSARKKSASSASRRWISSTTSAPTSSRSSCRSAARFCRAA